MLIKNVIFFMTIHSEINLKWKDSPITILPTIKYLVDSGIKLWIYRQAQFHYIKVLINTAMTI